MSSLLTWREGTASDRTELQVFECTEPGYKVRRGRRWVLEHPAIWELEVQAKIRSFRPPYHRPHALLVGRDDAGIGAVVKLEELDGPAQVELTWGAIARRHREKGGGIADEMLTEALDLVTGWAVEDGVTIVSVSALIHEKNRGAHRLVRDAHFRDTGHLAGTPLQQWTLELILT